MRKGSLPGLFAGSAVRLLVVVVGVSLVVALALMLFGDPGEGPQTGAHSASPSALGHSAFVECLRRSGFPVVVSRLPATARRGALLVLAEPEPGASEEARQRVREQLQNWERVLLVLPKRLGEEDEQHRGWVESVSLAREADVDGLLKDIDLSARVVRPEAETLVWRASPGFVGLLPTLSRPQLLTGTDLWPVLACDEGVLLGRIGEPGSLRTVLSDPDLLANHGIWRGENAALALAIVSELAAEGAPIVIDETLHGGVDTSHLWRELLRFPLALVSIQVVLTLGFVLLAGTRRFGPPVPVPQSLERGKQALLDHSARLLTLGRHERAILQRYWQQSLHEAAEARRLGPNVDPGTRLEHLGRWSAKLGLEEDPRELLEAVHALDERTTLGRGSSAGGRPADGQRGKRAAPHRTLRLARRIHAWREGMTNGSGTNS